MRGQMNQPREGSDGVAREKREKERERQRERESGRNNFIYQEERTDAGSNERVAMSGLQSLFGKRHWTFHQIPLEFIYNKQPSISTADLPFCPSLLPSLHPFFSRPVPFSFPLVLLFHPSNPQLHIFVPVHPPRLIRLESSLSLSSLLAVHSSSSTFVRQSVSSFPS